MTLEFVGQGHVIAEETVTRHLQPDHSSQHAAGVQPDADRQRHAVRLGHVASGCEIVRDSYKDVERRIG